MHSNFQKKGGPSFFIVQNRAQIQIHVEMNWKVEKIFFKFTLITLRFFLNLLNFICFLNDCYAFQRVIVSYALYLGLVVLQRLCVVLLVKSS